MTTCFISHSWCERQHDFALRLRDALRSKGIDAWVDEEQILGGDLIRGKMREGIMHKSDVFLLVLSPEALQSESCLVEMNWAFEQRRNVGMQIVPVLRKECGIPVPLQGILYVDFRDDKNFGRAVGRLLPAIKSAAEVKWLCSHLSADEAEERIEAARTLAKLRSRFTIPVISHRRSVDYDPEVQYWLALALGEIGGDEAIAALGEATGEPDPRASQGVADALLLLGREALEVVLRAAMSDDPFRRRTAARVLVDMRERDSRIKAVLARLKSDPDRRVQSVAQRA